MPALTALAEDGQWPFAQRDQLLLVFDVPHFGSRLEMTSSSSGHDAFSIGQSSGVNTLDVLANDSFAPDEGETLSVQSVGNSQAGATIAIGPGAASVLYTPAEGFVGSDTFTYTIRDGNGGVDQATIEERREHPMDRVVDHPVAHRRRRDQPPLGLRNA